MVSGIKNFSQQSFQSYKYSKFVLKNMSQYSKNSAVQILEQLVPIWLSGLKSNPIL